MYRASFKTYIYFRAQTTSLFRICALLCIKQKCSKREKKAVQQTDEIASFTLHILQCIKWGKRRSEYWAIWPRIGHSRYEATTHMWTVWTGKKKCVHCVYTKNEERNNHIESDIACILPDFISMDAEISDIYFFFYNRLLTVFSLLHLHLLSFTCFVLVIISVRTPNISQSGSMVGGVRASDVKIDMCTVNIETNVVVFCFSLFYLFVYFVVPFFVFILFWHFLCILYGWTWEQWTMYFRYVFHAYWIFHSIIWEVNEIENCWKCIRNTKLKLLVNFGLI